LKPRAAGEKLPTPLAAAPIILRHKAELEQSHLLLGAPGPSVTGENLYAASLLSLILGGGMSSRLFQSVREDRGLVYSISSAASPFNDCGYVGIYAAASTEQLDETIEATMEELRAIKEDSVDEVELQRNKDQLKASLMLNLESTSSRMSALATDEMIYGRFISPEEIIAKVNEVTTVEIQVAAREIFKPEAMAAVVLGDLDGFELDRAQLQC
jgi:predicted Zn-dependent peptidase